MAPRQKRTAIETAVSIVRDKKSKDNQEEQARAACLAKGGTWDGVNQVCILPETKLEKEPEFVPTKFDPVTGEQTAGKPPSPEVPGGRGPIKDSVFAGGPGREFAGLSPEKVRELRARELLSRQTTEEGLAGFEEEKAAQSQALIEQERQRLIAEETPQRRELSPELSFGEKVPLLGGVIGALSDIMRPSKKKLGFKTFEQLPPQEERNLALTEIARIERERGLTASEQFGKFAEATGFSKFDFFGLSVKDLVETPSENAIESMSNIRKEKRRITNIETNVKLGYLPVEVARDQIEDIEQNVIRLASRVGLLVSQSPELKFNSDFVNTMETEILQTEEKIFQAKQNILTGASIIPTETQILSKLQELQGEENGN